MLYNICYITSNWRLYNQRGFCYVARCLLYNKKWCYIAHPNLPDVRLAAQCQCDTIMIHGWTCCPSGHSTFTVESLSMPHTASHPGSLGHPNDRHRSPSLTRSPRLRSPRLSGGWPRCLGPGLTARLTFLPGPGLRLARTWVRLLIIRVLLSQIMSRWRRVDFSSPVTAWAGLALVSRAIRDSKKGGNIFRHRSSRDNKSNDGVQKRTVACDCQAGSWPRQAMIPGQPSSPVHVLW